MIEFLSACDAICNGHHCDMQGPGSPQQCPLYKWCNGMIFPMGEKKDAGICGCGGKGERRKVSRKDYITGRMDGLKLASRIAYEHKETPTYPYRIKGNEYHLKYMQQDMWVTDKKIIQALILFLKHPEEFAKNSHSFPGQRHLTMQEALRCGLQIG